jgi:hypothetical protein
MPKSGQNLKKTKSTYFGMERIAPLLSVHCENRNILICF